MTRKKRERRYRRQLARMGPIYSVMLDGEVIATIDPATRNGTMRAVQVGRRQLKIVEIRVRDGRVL